MRPEWHVKLRCSKLFEFFRAPLETRRWTNNDLLVVVVGIVIAEVVVAEYAESAGGYVAGAGDVVDGRFAGADAE